MGHKRQWIMAAAGVLMIAAAARIVVGSRAPATPPSIPAAPPKDSVSLFVQHDGPTLKLRWNPDSDAIRRASSGALFIEDGAHHSRLDLRPAELASGVASYWPTSPTVTFRLALDGVLAAELQAPALEVRHEERPSPFPSAAPKRVVSNTAARVVEEPDEDMPKPYTIRAADVPRRADRADADSQPKPSRLRRITGKIPLIRRLAKH